MALRPTHLLPPKRLLTPRSARRLSATNRGLLPGLPALTRVGLTPTGLTQLSGRTTNGPYVGGATQEEAHAITITNTSSHPCSLHGYVRIVAYDAHGVALPFRFAHHPTGGWPMATDVPPPFSIAPGASGYVFFAQIACYTGYSELSRRVAVTIPAARVSTPLILHTPLARCKGPSATVGNVIAMSPIEPTLAATGGRVP